MLLGDEDDVLLLDVALDDLETINTDVELSCNHNNCFICSNAGEHQIASDDQNDHAYCSSGIDSQGLQHNPETAADSLAADVTSNHGNMQAQVNQIEAQGVSEAHEEEVGVQRVSEAHREEAEAQAVSEVHEEEAEGYREVDVQRVSEAQREEAGVGPQRALDAQREEAEAQRMLEVLVDYINDHGELVSLENLLGAVNVNNMDDYLSVWHVQQQQPHHQDNSVWQAANNIPNQPPPAGDVEDQDEQRLHHGNQDDDLIVVIENHLDDVMNYHDNLVVDVDDDANRRVVVHQNDDIILDHDVIREAVVADHYADEAVFDLGELLHIDVAAAVPPLDLAAAEDLAFDAGKYFYITWRPTGAELHAWPESFHFESTTSFTRTQNLRKPLRFPINLIFILQDSFYCKKLSLVGS